MSEKTMQRMQARADALKAHIDTAGLHPDIVVGLRIQHAFMEDFLELAGFKPDEEELARRAEEEKLRKERDERFARNVAERTARKEAERDSQGAASASLGAAGSGGSIGGGSSNISGGVAGNEAANTSASGTGGDAVPEPKVAAGGSGS